MMKGGEGRGEHQRRSAHIMKGEGAARSRAHTIKKGDAREEQQWSRAHMMKGGRARGGSSKCQGLHDEEWGEGRTEQ